METNSLPDSEAGHSKKVLLENNKFKILLIPELGGKIVKIIRKKTGTQFLRKPDTDLSKYPQPEYGDEFLPPLASGFDECFPNISPSLYAFDGKEVALPDHGELWNQAWNYESNGTEIRLWTSGSTLDYEFTKNIQLTDSGMEIRYKLENLEELSLDYIWSSHPLMEIHPGDELLLPDEITEVLLNWASDPSLGKTGTLLQWPKIFEDNPNIDFTIVQEKSLGFAVKLYSERLKKGTAGIYRDQTDETFSFTFDVNQIPFLGIWLCYGGWPKDSSEKEFTLALEPCSGRPDSLVKACQWGDQQRISSSDIKRWQLQIHIIDGKPNYIT